MTSFILYIIVLIISVFFNTLPRKISLFFGRLIGTTIYYFIPIRKHVAICNIKDNFPKLNNDEQYKLLKKTYIHFGMVLSDFLRQKELDLFTLRSIVNIDDETIKVLKKNKGSIIMTGHLGNWEYFLPILGLNNIKFSVVAQKIKNSYLNKLFLKYRTFKNIKIIFKNEGKEKMINALKNDYHLGLASDQNARKRGVPVNFLNIKVSIPKGAGIFHLKTNKPILIGYCIMDKNLNYNFTVKPLNISQIRDSKKDFVKGLNTIFAKHLGDMINEYPEQYFWFHKMKDKKDYL